jgi:sec-independent protein translocase protein TatA
VPGWVGPWELLILVGVLLLIFGPKRLPEIGRSLGRGVREVKEAVRIDEPKADEAVDGKAEEEAEDGDWLSLPKLPEAVGPRSRARRLARRRLRL